MVIGIKHCNHDPGIADKGRGTAISDTHSEGVCGEGLTIKIS